MVKHDTTVLRCLLGLARLTSAATQRLLDRALEQRASRADEGLRYEISYARHRARELLGQLETAAGWLQ